MDTLIVALSGDAWQGNPIAEVQVDHQLPQFFPVVALHGKGQVQPIEIQGEFGPGPHVVRVTFTNDAWGGTSATDRNLYLHGVSMNGSFYGAAASLMSSGQGASVVIPGYDTPYWNPDMSKAFIGTGGIIGDFDGSNHPPLLSQAANFDFFPYYYYGWPTNTGTTADLSGAAARMGLSDNTQHCMENSGLVQVTASGGNPAYLALTATKGASNHFNEPWASGLVTQSMAKAFQGYGYWEVVMLGPPQPLGFWWGSWLLGMTGSPAYNTRIYPPEFDIIEMVGNNGAAGNPPTVQNKTYYHINVIQSQSGGGYAGNSGGGFYNTGIDLTAQPHKYGTKITPTYTYFYFDDVQIGPAIATSSDMNANVTLYLLMNLNVGASGNGFCGSPPGSITSAAVKVFSAKSFPAGSFSGTIPRTPPAPLVV